MEIPYIYLIPIVFGSIMVLMVAFTIGYTRGRIAENKQNDKESRIINS